MPTTKTKINAKQMEFINHWLINGHNASQAYKSAYPNCKSSAKENACVLLTKPNIKAEIEHRQAETSLKHTADREERREFLTKTMRSAPNMNDKLRACELMGKMDCDYITVNYDLTEEKQVLDAQQLTQAGLIAQQLVANANRKVIESEVLDNE